MPAAFLVSTLGLFLPDSGLAAAPAAPSAQAETINGPAMTPLGTIGQLSVPQAYQFVGVETAKRFFLGQNQTVPAGLLGLMAPAFTPQGTPSMQIVFQFTDAGYVKDKGATNIDADTVMKGIRANADKQNDAMLARGQQVMPSPQWELRPKYDPATHKVEWAIRAGDTINHTIRYFGRHGWVDVVCVYPRTEVPLNLAMLKTVFTFNAGEGYADFKPGDKFSRLTVAASIPSEGGNPAPASMAMLPLWIGLGLAGSAALVALVLVVKRVRRHPAPTRVAPQPRHEVPAPAPLPAHAPLAAAPGKPAPAITETGTAAPPATPKPKPAAMPVRPAALPLPARPQPQPAFVSQQSLRRKRAFDYNRYFADLMSTVSSHGPMEPAAPNGTTEEAEKAAATPTPTNGGNLVQPSLFTANLELIAHQTSFIEEQRRLIQEQARLIEEKSRLIAEKNQLLKMQSELMENKLL